MHNLKPSTDYKIVTVQIAARANLSDAQITDGLTEMLRAACAAEEGTVEDWQFVAVLSGAQIAAKVNEMLRATKPVGNFSDYEIRHTSEQPEEGELFR